MNTPIEVSTGHEEINKEKILLSIGFNPQLPTLLLKGNCMGSSQIVSLYKKISKVPVDFQIIVITGNNMRAFDRLQYYIYGAKLVKKRVKFIRHISRFAKKIFGKKVDFENISKKITPVKDTRLYFTTDEASKFMKIADAVIAKTQK